MRAIDAWVNLSMGGRPEPWQLDVAANLFKRPPQEVFRSPAVEEMIEIMDRAEIERVIVTVPIMTHLPKILPFVELHPDRFALAAYVDPRRGLKAIRELEKMVAEHPVVAARVIPSLINVAPDDRIYYPLYAKCVELALPISVNTGIPGPRLPGRCQDPMHLDEVCLYFPELSVIMANGADPWWDVAIRLMLKYPRLTLMTSAFAPKYLPPQLVHYMNTRGQDKVMFATDYPFLDIDRCVDEAKALDLRERVLSKYLYENAKRVFFPENREEVAPSGGGDSDHDG